MIALLQERGGYMCNPDEKERLREVMWPDGTHLSPKVVGQSAEKIPKNPSDRTPRRSNS